MISFVTSAVGAAPVGTVTVGCLASGPLAGVFTVAVVLVGVDVVAAAVLLPSVSSALFSLPTVMVLLEPLEPQPAISAAVASAARASVAPERSFRKPIR